jgi:hypothetical protein
MSAIVHAEERSWLELPEALAALIPVTVELAQNLGI